MHLERSSDLYEEKEDKDDSEDGFVEGFKECIQPGLNATKENVDEFNCIIEKNTNADSSEISGNQKGE